MNKNLLRSKMVLFGDTNETLATALGISPQRLSAKINAKDGAEFTQGEINVIKKLYRLTLQELNDIFFAD